MSKFNSTIPAFKPSDKAHANLFNKKMDALLENDNFLLEKFNNTSKILSFIDASEFESEMHEETHSVGDIILFKNHIDCPLVITYVIDELVYVDLNDGFTMLEDNAESLKKGYFVAGYYYLGYLDMSFTPDERVGRKRYTYRPEIFPEYNAVLEIVGKVAYFSFTISGGVNMNLDGEIVSILPSDFGLEDEYAYVPNNDGTAEFPVLMEGHRCIVRITRGGDFVVIAKEDFTLENSATICISYLFDGVDLS